MEAIGSSIMLILLLFGAVFLFSRTSKAVGIILILIALFFLYITAAISFSNYKKSIRGEFINAAGATIIINDAHDYFIFSDGKQTSKGQLKFIDIDLYSFYLDNDEQIHSTRDVDVIEDARHSDVYKKRE
jgi:4-amino-4-deoxy-L-arabinose transferase-like glycosyltransferase